MPLNVSLLRVHSHSEHSEVEAETFFCFVQKKPIFALAFEQGSIMSPLHSQKVTTNVNHDILIK